MKKKGRGHQRESKPSRFLRNLALVTAGTALAGGLAVHSMSGSADDPKQRAKTPTTDVKDAPKMPLPSQKDSVFIAPKTDSVPTRPTQTARASTPGFEAQFPELVAATDAVSQAQGRHEACMEGTGIQYLEAEIPKQLATIREGIGENPNPILEKFANEIQGDYNSGAFTEFATSTDVYHAVADKYLQQAEQEHGVVAIKPHKMNGTQVDNTLKDLPENDRADDRETNIGIIKDTYDKLMYNGRVVQQDPARNQQVQSFLTIASHFHKSGGIVMTDPSTGLPYTLRLDDSKLSDRALGALARSARGVKESIDQTPQENMNAYTHVAGQISKVTTAVRLGARYMQNAGGQKLSMPSQGDCRVTKGLLQAAKNNLSVEEGKAAKKVEKKLESFRP